ncbi:MAG: hypothetical protein U0175_13650 [Caldilineaceae bacterium]
MKRVIFLFLDGVGLGSDDPAINPLAAQVYPTFSALLDGHLPTQSTGRLSTAQAELIPTDAQMGVPGRPQSATGQAAILTGINAPQRLGEHYGPRPDARVRAVIDEANLFHRLRQAGRSVFFYNGYPERYFKAIHSGKRLLSAIPYAVTQAGLPLSDHLAVVEGRAMSADFTNQGWIQELGYTNTPLLSPNEAGYKLWELAQPHHFSFFEHWYTDVLGHEQALEKAVSNFQCIDGVLAGLLEVADLQNTLIIVSSDHGNVEDCSHGKHTENPVFTLLLGDQRQALAEKVQQLADFAPIIDEYLHQSRQR